MSRPRNGIERTQITTNFRTDLLESVDSLASNLKTNRNIILEMCYNKLIKESSLYEFKDIMEEYKGGL